MSKKADKLHQMPVKSLKTEWASVIFVLLYRCVRKVEIQRSETSTTFLIYESNNVNELPVRNFIFQHSRRHCPKIYEVLEPASGSPSRRNLPPAFWTTSWLLLAPHLNFSRSAVVTSAEWGRMLSWSRHTLRDNIPLLLFWMARRSRVKASQYAAALTVAPGDMKSTSRTHFLSQKTGAMIFSLKLKF